MEKGRMPHLKICQVLFDLPVQTRVGFDTGTNTTNGSDLEAAQGSNVTVTSNAESAPVPPRKSTAKRRGKSAPDTPKKSTTELQSETVHVTPTKSTTEPDRESKSKAVEKPVFKNVEKAGDKFPGITDSAFTHDGPFQQIKSSASSTKQSPGRYTQAETQRLYLDKSFVIQQDDVDSDLDGILIWRIDDSRCCLQKFYPAKFGVLQFFVSTPVRWYFLKEDFKSPQFFKKFQPIPVIIVHEKVSRPDTFFKTEVIETTAQYVYIDKSFFNRMAKYLGQIYRSEHLREDFRKYLIFYCFKAHDPTFSKNSMKMKDISPQGSMFEAFEDIWKAWDIIEGEIQSLLTRFPVSALKLTEKATTALKWFPDLQYSTKDVDKGRRCTACPKQRAPYVRVVIPGGTIAKPYDYESLLHLEINGVDYDRVVGQWCKDCSNRIKKYRRLLHFRYNVLNIVSRNMVHNAEDLKQAKIPLTDQAVFRIMSADYSWQNQMFLKFQVNLAEFKAEFLTRK